VVVDFALSEEILKILTIKFNKDFYTISANISIRIENKVSDLTVKLDHKFDRIRDFVVKKMENVAFR